MSTYLECLESTGLFDTLSSEELVLTAEQARETRVAAGEVIVREGERIDSLMVITSGSAQIFGFGRDGAEIVLAKLESGAHFGEQALLPKPERWTANVRAYSDLEVLRVDREAFQQALPEGSPLKSSLIPTRIEPISNLFGRKPEIFRSLALGTPDAIARRERFKDGEVVYADGDPSDQFYLVIDGTAAVWVTVDGAPRQVARLTHGQCFGELALLRQEPRRATIRAEGDLMLLSIDGRRFLDVMAGQPDLKDFIQTVQKVYLLQGKGFTTQHAGMLQGLPAITTIYHLTDGRRLVGSRVIGRDIYSLTVVTDGTGESTQVRYVENDGGDERQIGVLDSHITGLTVHGNWTELGEAHQYLLENKPIEPWQLEVFKAHGSLHLEQEATFFQDPEVICACMQTTRGDLRGAIHEGASDVDSLGGRTGAGTVCGGCIPKLRELLGRSDWDLVVCDEVDSVTDRIRTFRFRTEHGEFMEAKPGQHIVLQARIDGHWIQRPYTLSSSGTETGFREITVKREPVGLFSGWLFDQMKPDSLARVSGPQGNFFANAQETAPVVCFVAGIGVTPAVSMARTFAGMSPGRRLHVDYSFSRRSEAAFVQELEGLVASSERLSVTLRETRSGAGRIGSEDVEAVVRELPDAEYYICGPESFELDVIQGLKALGIPEGRFHVERFTPSSGKPANNPRGVLLDEVGHPARPVPSPTPPGPRPGDRTALPEIVVGEPASIAEEARAYLLRFFHEKGVPTGFDSRWKQVEQSIRSTGTYTQTYDELSFGCKLAWRNSTRCIGRLFWQGLQVRDMRHVTDPDGMFESVCEHIRLATNGGNLRAVMTVFAPEAPGVTRARLWNSQLLRYAGYKQEDGAWIGDPANGSLTEAVKRLGWSRKPKSHFDLLPLVFQVPGERPYLYEIPTDLILEVHLTHPELSWFGQLGLKWYALPAVAELMLDCGGVTYRCAPFNGWYMGTELGARNFSDEHRYNQLPVIAKRLGIDMSHERKLWRDRALLELNVAVLHSFELAGVKMVDHHTASTDFLEFTRQEATAGRRIDARWDWIVPPMSGSLSPLFHTDWVETIVKPNYFPQDRPYESEV